MDSKLKLKQYAEYKGFSIYQIEKKCKLSHGSLKSGKEFSVDKLPQIRDNCPDLNINWLVYDEGEMLLKDSYTLQEPEVEYKKDVEKSVIEGYKELLKAKDETIKILKHQLGIKNNGNSKAS